MESSLPGLILDSSVIIAAERKRQTVEQFLTADSRAVPHVCRSGVRRSREVTLAELVHGVARASTPDIRLARVHPVMDSTAEIAGQISGEQAAKGITPPADDLLIGASAIEQG